MLGRSTDLCKIISNRLHATCGGGQTELQRGIHFGFYLFFYTPQYIGVDSVGADSITPVPASVRGKWRTPTTPPPPTPSPTSPKGHACSSPSSEPPSEHRRPATGRAPTVHAPGVRGRSVGRASQDRTTPTPHHGVVELRLSPINHKHNKLATKTLY